MTTLTAAEVRTEVQSAVSTSAPTAWGNLYRIASVAAVVIIGIYVLDIALVAAPGGADNISEFTVVEWFDALQTNRFMALRNLGIFNVLTLLLNVPLFAAWYGVHRHAAAPFAALAAILGFIGIAIYVSNNPAMALLHLSDQYSEAATDTERAMIVGSAQALLAQGEDFAPGAFAGFVVPSVATIAMAWVMLHAKRFRPVTGWLLLLGTTLLLIYTTIVTFMPSLNEAALMLAMVGGLMAVAGYAMVARRLWQLGVPAHTG